MKKVVVIAGGAGQGISGVGLAITRHLAAQGYALAVIDKAVQPDEMAALFQSGQHKYYQLDLADLAALKAAVKQVETDFGKIHHLVSNVGGALPDEVSQTRGALVDEAVWDASIGVNLNVPYYLVKNFRPLFDLDAPDRSITLMSSINAHQGYGLVAYSAAKAGLIGLMHACAGELGECGIRINCILPGTIKPQDENKDMKAFNNLAAQSCLKRLAVPHDIAVAVEHVINQPHMSAAQLVLDGGQSVYQTF